MECERLPFDPQAPGDIFSVFRQYRVSETYHMHTHTYYEIFYVLKGQALHEINGVSQVLSEGSLVFIRPEDRHFYRYFNFFEFDFINITFKEECFLDALKWLDLPQNLLMEPTLPPQLTITGPERSEYRRRLTDFVRMPFNNARRRVFRSIIPQLILRFYVQAEDEGSPSVLPEWLSNLLQEMEKPENFTQGLQRMLSLANYSQEHLTRCFRRYLGSTPTAYLNTKRLGYAAELLLSGDYSVLELCEVAGFNNLSHFYHLFKQQYGCSPKEFIQREKEAGAAPAGAE